MKITHILLEACIISDLESLDKTSVIKELSFALQKANPEIDPEEVTKILLDREKLGSTGIGSGVAIPHGKSGRLSHIVAAFGRSKKGVDFDSQDGEPTHLFFALIAPENSAGDHLKALAKLSRLLKHSSFRDKLMEAPDAAGIYQIITEEDQRS